MSGVADCPRCAGIGLLDVDVPQGNLPAATSSSVTCPRCDGLGAIDVDEDGRPLDEPGGHES